jgi:enamine deaminase RidA (YjgF/YER057c/UK114 family)
VDNNYAGLVKARNEFFTGIGLTGKTHFIASTGIEGNMSAVNRLVKMDSLSYPGATQAQFVYLSAPEMLSPTALYGVSFERGTRMLFGDRSHLFISGTASIDKAGFVVHPGDVLKQTSRMLDNVQALLACGQAELSDIKIATLYLRDIADAPAVTELIKSRLGTNIPLVALKAPVCRPAWLVEFECIAVNPAGDQRFAVLQ